MLNLKKVTNIEKMKSKPNENANLRTAHVCMCVILLNCCKQHNTMQLWLSSLLTSRQTSQLRCSLLLTTSLSWSPYVHSTISN